MTDFPALTPYLRTLEQLRDQFDSGLSSQDIALTFDHFLHYSDQIIRSIHMVQAFMETSALVVSSLDVETVLDRVLDTIIEIAGAERAYIMLREHVNDPLSIVSARRWDQESLSESDTIYSTLIVDAVLHKREPLVALNAQDDPMFRDSPTVAANALRSLLCVPLLLRDEVIGVLYADNRVTRGAFSDKTLLPVMNAFANHVVVALENARHYNETGDVRWLQIQTANQRLVEPLTNTELRVLGLICEGLNNTEIAEHLTVEKATVRKHINNTYGKLGAEGSRGKAIALARELGLV